MTVDATKSQINNGPHHLVSRLNAFLCISSSSDDAPDVVGGQQDEDQTDEEDGRACPLKLAVLPILKIRQRQLHKECDGQHHAQRRKHHAVHYSLDLFRGVAPGLLIDIRITAGRKGRRAGQRCQQAECCQHRQESLTVHRCSSSRKWESRPDLGRLSSC